MDDSTWAAIAQAFVSIGLLIFAGVQLHLMRAQERMRVKERHLDAAAKTDTAYGVVWAEYNRIRQLSDQIASADVVTAVYAKLLIPSDVLPRDWATSTQHLGQLGIVPAELGAVAYSVLHDVAMLIRRLDLGFDRARDAYAPAAFDMSLLRTDEMSRLRDLEAQIRHRLEEAANVLLDALDHSPNAAQRQVRTYNEELHSEHARRFVKAAQQPPGSEN